MLVTITYVVDKKNMKIQQSNIVKRKEQKGGSKGKETAP